MTSIYVRITQIISGHVYREHSGMALKSSIAWLQEVI